MNKINTLVKTAIATVINYGKKNRLKDYWRVNVIITKTLREITGE